MDLCLNIFAEKKWTRIQLFYLIILIFPAGYYKSQQDCVKCASGFYADLPNNLPHCSRCTACDRGGK